MGRAEGEGHQGFVRDVDGRCCATRPVGHALRGGAHESEDHQCPAAPERAAYVRMLLHCTGCRDCLIVDDTGAVGTCVTSDRLYEEYRQARRGAVPGNGL